MKLNNRSLYLLISSFAIIYFLISFVNHYLFRTAALDLGAYTNAMYDYSHLKWNDCAAFKVDNENILADHFDLYLILFSPLIFIFKTYTLLIIQIIFVLIGGIGVNKYLKKINASTTVAFLGTLYFYSFFGVFSAITFDYHSNVISACVVPWFFLNIKKENLKIAFALLLFILIGKENMSLWMAFICLGLLFEYRNNKLIRNTLIIASALCIGYFVFITTIIMPSFANNHQYHHFHFSYLGNNYSQAIFHLISHPIESFKMLFINHVNNPNGNYVKTELLLFLVFSGIPILFYNPRFLIMLLPIFFQKLFHDNYVMWSIDAQYNIEFAPILAIGIFQTLLHFKNVKKQKTMAISLAILSIIVTFRMMDQTIYFTDKSKIRFYQKNHYSTDYNANIIYEKLKIIPKNAIISSQTYLLPHLSLRDKIYEFPTIKDAQFIVFSKKMKNYNLSDTEFKTQYSKLKNSNNWKSIVDCDDITIFKKI